MLIAMAAWPQLRPTRTQGSVCALGSGLSSLLSLPPSLSLPFLRLLALRRVVVVHGLPVRLLALRRPQRDAKLLAARALLHEQEGGRRAVFHTPTGAGGWEAGRVPRTCSFSAASASARTAATNLSISPSSFLADASTGEPPPATAHGARSESGRGRGHRRGRGRGGGREGEGEGQGQGEGEGETEGEE